MSTEMQMIPQGNSTPARLLEIAVSQGADLDKLDKLMQLQERWEASEARKAYVQAMAAFKAEPITVAKSKTVDFNTQKGRTHYTHATLADVVDAAVSGMGRHGLSHRWDVRQEAGRITVQCIVTHERGHSESTSLTSNPDDSGNKNQIQQVGSAITYLQRYTLMAALGLAASDMQEDDGRGSGASSAGRNAQAAPTEAQEAKAVEFADAIAQAETPEQLQELGPGIAKLPSVLKDKLRSAYADRMAAIKPKDAA